MIFHCQRGFIKTREKYSGLRSSSALCTLLPYSCLLALALSIGSVNAASAQSGDNDLSNASPAQGYQRRRAESDAQARAQHPAPGGAITDASEAATPPLPDLAPVKRPDHALPSATIAPSRPVRRAADLSPSPFARHQYSTRDDADTSPYLRRSLARNTPSALPPASNAPAPLARARAPYPATPHIAQTDAPSSRMATFAPFASASDVYHAPVAVASRAAAATPAAVSPTVIENASPTVAEAISVPEKASSPRHPASSMTRVETPASIVTPVITNGDIAGRTVPAPPPRPAPFIPDSPSTHLAQDQDPPAPQVGVPEASPAALAPIDAADQRGDYTYRSGTPYAAVPVVVPGAAEPSIADPQLTSGPGTAVNRLASPLPAHNDAADMSPQEAREEAAARRAVAAPEPVTTVTVAEPVNAAYAPAPAPAITLPASVAAPGDQPVPEVSDATVLRHADDRHGVRYFTPEKQDEPLPAGTQIPSSVMAEATAVGEPLPVAESAPVSAPAPAESLSPETLAILNGLPPQTSRPAPHDSSSRRPLAISRRTDDEAMAIPKVKKLSRVQKGLEIEIKPQSIDLSLENEHAYNALIAGDTEGAIRIYKEVLSIDPSEKNALFGLATTYQRIGRIEDARPLYARLLKEDPYNVEALNNFLALVGMEAPHAAIEQLQRLGEDNPNFGPIPAQIALLYQKMGDFPNAEQYMAEAASISPDNLAYKYNLAIICDQGGDRPRAIQYYHELLQAHQLGQPLPASAQKIQERLTFLESN